MRSTQMSGVCLILCLGASACTLTDFDQVRGDGDAYVVTATASCLGFCAPERSALIAAMHARCAWPSVPAIQARGTESNGLLGVPHAAWRFTCLTVPHGRG